MPYQLSKSEKKIARDCIEKGVQAEFRKGLEKAKQVIAEWEDSKLDNREAYYKLFTSVQEQDKHIAYRYDGMTGSRYLNTVSYIFHDGQITEEDIKDFSDEAKEIIKRRMSLWDD